MEIILVEWKDVSYSRVLASTEEAREKVKPKTVQTLGFKVGQDKEKIDIAQVYNRSRKTFVNISTIPTSLVSKVSILHKKLAKRHRVNSPFLIEWRAEADFRDKAYDLERVKKLNPSRIIAVGFLGSKRDGDVIKLFGERVKGGKSEFRIPYEIDKNLISKSYML